MRNPRVCLFSASVLASALILLPHFVLAQEASKVDVDKGSAKHAALEWIEQFRKVQVLFNDKDLERLYKEVAELSEKDAEQWLKSTQDVRDALDSERWQGTREWLRQFLRMQAIYTDEQIAEFRSESKENVRTSPESFLDVLARIEGRRSAWTSGIASNTALRDQTLSLNRAYRQRAFEQREAASRNRSARPDAGLANTPATPANRSRSAPPPIVSSLDVARRTAARSFWGYR